MSKTDQVKTHPGMVSHSDSREHIGEHLTTGGKPKGGTVMVHPGMRTRGQNGADALSGHHASALDSLSGATVPAARNMTAPGWGNAGVQSGHPLAKPPGSKNVKAAPVAFGMKARGDIHAVGAAILDAAFSCGAPDDRMAHGRGPDGKKCK